MDAPQSKRFREMLREDPKFGAKVMKSNIQGRRLSWLDRAFESKGKKFKIVSLGEKKILDLDSENRHEDSN